MTPLKIWAKRFTVARGWMWLACREVSPHEADQWLVVFQRDEPEIEFRLSYGQPTNRATKDHTMITITINETAVEILEDQLRDIVSEHLKSLTSYEKEQWLDDVSGGDIRDLRRELEDAEDELSTFRNTEAGVIVEPEDMNRVFSLSLCGRRADALEILAEAASEHLGRRL